jgi:hypothetical protein
MDTRVKLNGTWHNQHGSEIENGEEVIRAAWHMAVTLPNGKSDELWKGIWTGEDVFQRGAASASRIKRPARMPSSPLPDA